MIAPLDHRQLILNPTRELLDEALLEVNEINNDYMEAYAKYERYLYWFEGLVDELLVGWEEKQKTKAEARVRNENPWAIAKWVEIYTQKRTREAKLGTAKMNYYHAREKIMDNRDIDVEASRLWDMF